MSQETLQLIAELERDNAALRSEVAQLRNFRTLALRDELTGLANRRSLYKRLSQEISLAARHPERHFSVAVIDVNHFKEINDTYGHAAGDETLRWLGGFLERTFRHHDVVFRLGGDEFAVILPETMHAERLKPVARLRASLDRENARRILPVHISIGVASWPKDARTPSGILEAADLAMYRDKAQQKPRSAPVDSSDRISANAISM
jgi:diguanylate cyclase (GGDEF)-like protein